MPNTSDSISGKKETWNSQDDGKNAWNLFALYLELPTVKYTSHICRQTRTEVWNQQLVGFKGKKKTRKRPIEIAYGSKEVKKSLGSDKAIHEYLVSQQVFRVMKCPEWDQHLFSLLQKSPGTVQVRTRELPAIQRQPNPHTHLNILSGMHANARGGKRVFWSKEQKKTSEWQEKTLRPNERNTKSQCQAHPKYRLSQWPTAIAFCSVSQWSQECVMETQAHWPCLSWNIKN